MHIRECCLSCKHVAVQPQISVNKFLITKRLFGSLAHEYTASVRKSKWTHLKGEQILTHKRWMSKSSQPDLEELSLDNPRVQAYLRRLRKDHEQSEARAQTAKDQGHLMMLLDQVEQVQSEMKELSALAESNEGGKEMQDLAREELQEARQKLLDMQEEVLSALVPEEVVDDRNVVVEVSAGVGGQEAMLFCQEVFNMYLSYAQYRGWEEQVIDYETTEIGGLRHGSIVLNGDYVYGSLKYEGGTHRVQRVPKTEKAGRVHTSTVSVAVLPQPSEIDIQIAEKDLRIETKRASGAGGQHVNTTNSAVRITHLPSGLFAESQSERSQHRNRDNCMRKLRARLYQQQLDHDTHQYTSNRKLQIGGRGRSEKIRTYNYPQDRVTDHRVGVSLHNLAAFMSGTDTFHALVCQLLEEGQREALQEIIFSKN